MNKDQIPSNRIKKKGGGLFSNSNYVLSQGFKCRKVYFLEIRSSLYFFSFSSLLSKKKQETYIH